MTPRRLRLLAALGCIAVIAPTLWLVAREQLAAVPPKELYQPSRMPDRIVLTWTADPARTQAVTWRTDANVTEGLAEIALATPGPEFVRDATKVTATMATLESDLGVANYHTVQFADLQPRTKYAYRVGDGVNWSEWFHFRTADDRPEPFTFVYLGDAQNDVRSLWSRVIREAHADAPRARFIIHAGDLINNANNDAQWGEWFGAGDWLNAMLPSVPTPGNHEYVPAPAGDGTKVNRLSRHWRPQFALPQNGPPGLEETVYWLDYQGVRIVSLNSNEQTEVQGPWLDRLLSDNPCRWTIVTFHHPIFSAAKSRDNVPLRAKWKPVFDRQRVDLVLTGHDHTYARSGLEVPENVPAGANVRSAAGTVYVVSVSGPKMYNVNRQEWMQRAAEDTQLYQIIHIDGDSLRYEARTAVGDLYDAFTLRKREGQPNELIEQIPAVPERLRKPNS